MKLALRFFSTLLLAGSAFAGLAYAAEPAAASTLLTQAATLPATAAPAIDKADTAWMMLATALVILMSLPGLALFYGGLVRSKNMLSVLVQVFTIFSLISVL